MDEPDVILGRIAVERGWITPAQLREALGEQARDIANGRWRPRKLGNILLTKGHLDHHRLSTLMVDQQSAAASARGADHTEAENEAFAQYVLKTLMATPEQVREAQLLQEKSRTKVVPLSIAAALVLLGVITPTQRETVLKRLRVPREGLRRLGPCLLVRKIGEGGMGAVYLADDMAAGRQVAIKVLHPEKAGDAGFIQRFIREADAATRLNHPNIVQAFSRGEDGGRHFYMMEFIQGETLSQRLGRGKSIPVEEALPIVAQVARGLRYAHDLGFIHRDIKPENVVVAPDGTTKIHDFGLTKNIERQGTFRTMDGIAFGTPYYLSPEQARGAKDIDGRADIYSLGATFYHLVTGETPFQGASSVEIISKHFTDQIPDPRDVREDIPEGVAHVIRRMMAKHPGDRYRDCGKLLADLDRLVRGKSPVSQALDPSLSSVALPAPRARRKPAAPGTARGQRDALGRKAARRLILGLSGAAFLAVWILVAAATRHRPKPRPGAGVPPAPSPVAAPDPSAAPASPQRQDAREQEARRKLDLLQAIEAGGRVPFSEMRGRYENFAREYADTSAGRHIRDWLSTLPPRPDSP